MILILILQPLMTISPSSVPPVIQSDMLTTRTHGCCYFGGYDDPCHYGNDVQMTRPEVHHLKEIVAATKPAIPCYVCSMNRTFVATNKRMYFSVHFTKIYLKNFLSEPIDTSPIKRACCYLQQQVRLIMGQDNCAAITTNCTQFINAASITQGNIYVFSFVAESGQLALTTCSLTRSTMQPLYFASYKSHRQIIRPMCLKSLYLNVQFQCFTHCYGNIQLKMSYLLSTKHYLFASHYLIVVSFLP